MEESTLAIESIAESTPVLKVSPAEKMLGVAQKVGNKLDGFMMHFLASSKPIGVVLILIAIIFLISTIASGVQANKNDDKNEQQRASIRGFSAASGIFMVVCLGLGIFLIVAHYKLLPKLMGADAYGVWKNCFAA